MGSALDAPGYQPLILSVGPAQRFKTVLLHVIHAHDHIDAASLMRFYYIGLLSASLHHELLMQKAHYLYHYMYCTTWCISSIKAVSMCCTCVIYV